MLLPMTSRPHRCHGHCAAPNRARAGGKRARPRWTALTWAGSPHVERCRGRAGHVPVAAAPAAAGDGCGRRVGDSGSCRPGLERQREPGRR